MLSLTLRRQIFASISCNHFRRSSFTAIFYLFVHILLEYWGIRPKIRPVLYVKWSKLWAKRHTEQPIELHAESKIDPCLPKINLRVTFYTIGQFYNWDTFLTLWSIGCYHETFIRLILESLPSKRVNDVHIILRSKPLPPLCNLHKLFSVLDGAREYYIKQHEFQGNQVSEEKLVIYGYAATLRDHSFLALRLS